MSVLPHVKKVPHFISLFQTNLLSLLSVRPKNTGLMFIRVSLTSLEEDVLFDFSLPTLQVMILANIIFVLGCRERTGGEFCWSWERLEVDVTRCFDNVAHPQYNQSEAVVRRFSSKQVFLKISQISQESNCVRLSF